MQYDSKIYVAGHRGLVGQAMVKQLSLAGFNNLILRTHEELDLTNQAKVNEFFADERPDIVILAAARVGGIQANFQFPADFIFHNLNIQTHVINACKQYAVKQLLFLGSSCIYPRECPQPMLEEYLLTAPLEFTNRPYAVAKIAGIEMCWAYNRQYNHRYLAVMPTNLYGPGDNYDLNQSHVLPALLRKMHEAKLRNDSTVEVWGTGRVKREFLFSEDLANACLFLLQQRKEKLDFLFNEDHPPLINIGMGKDLSIKELALLIKEIVGFNGELVWNTDKPDGTPRKLLNISRLTGLGWQAKTDLEHGIKKTYQAFLRDYKNIAN